MIPAPVKAGPEVVTFGCRLNAVEGDAIAVAAGGRDVAVVNSCAVTAGAVREAGKAVRRLRRERPDRPVVVTGCAAQIEPARFAAMAGVAAVLGQAEKSRPAVWNAVLGNRNADAPAAIRVADIAQARRAAPEAEPDTPAMARGFLPVQNGCDHRCTFCIIPFGRGRSRSVPMSEAVAAARRLLERGAREIVLTGVDLTGYGADLPGSPTLGRLVAAVLAALPDLPRLRLSSIDGAEADADLLDAFAREARLMPHLHLSLQAGDDMVLTRMKRRHRRADAIRFCERVRRLRPDAVFGADLIAGFPTETDGMFARSLDLVAECGLTHLHVFPFSARPGTPAARMPAVPGPVVTERAARLREAGAAALAAHLDAQIGRTLPVLVETASLGRTEGYASVRLAREAAPGAIVPVPIAGHDGRRLLAAA